MRVRHRRLALLPPSLFLLWAGPCGRQPRGLRAMAGPVAAVNSAARLQAMLDMVDPAAAPCVRLARRPESDGGAEDLLAVQSLLVLDSSFNPPTRAHMHLLERGREEFQPEGSMLLLAKQNADKPVVGATLVQRLQMMELLVAADARKSLACGLTGHPLFVDKAAALRKLVPRGSRIMLLVGFDTWVRIVDPKYYAEGQLPRVLREIFDNVEVLVASRDASSAANLEPMSTAEQQAAVDGSVPEDVASGRLHFLPVESPLSKLSSSAVRKAVEAGDVAAADEMVPEALRAFISEAGLYKDR